jgi:CheY-like chemotaxis protein
MKDLTKLKIMLVEDNYLNVKLILSLFSEHSLKLQIAENGSVCIEKLKENNGSTSLTTCFDIILMDMEMPVMNGYEAATIIRDELKNNIPIIAMTAHAMSGEREKCLSLGMNDYISKPLNANQLFEKMYDLTAQTESLGATS